MRAKAMENGGLRRPCCFERAPKLVTAEMEEQRICLKFCFKNGIKCSQALQMLQQAFGDNTMQKTVAYQWYARFRDGREETTDDARSGRPSTSKTPEKRDEVLTLVRANRRITCREVSDELNISLGSAFDIMSNDLGLKKVTAVLVPKTLTFAQMERAHTALKVADYLREMQMSVLPQPPYSPDLAPADFFLFGKLKNSLKGSRFDSIPEIQDASARTLKDIPQSDFQKSFDHWKKRWQKCIEVGGDYFDGDTLNIED
jgi:transposase